jgi:hypothetical protein
VVAISESFRASWIRQHELHDIAQLEQLAAWLIALYGTKREKTA